MHPARRIQSFVARHPLAGPVVWQLTVQFFLVQAVVASAWTLTPYSWLDNPISDLAATSCGMFDDRFVCSPQHGLMNASLILLGLCMAAGSVLAYQQLRKSRAGFATMAVAGIGAILVGLFPENTIYPMHLLGADLAFLLGNIALIIFGIQLPMPRWFKWYSIASGAVALVALILFLSHATLFLGIGGMERVVAYPMIIWLVVTGVYLAKNRVRGAAKQSVH